MRCQTKVGMCSSVERNETRKDEVLMAKQVKPTGQRKQQRRGALWLVLLIGAFLVAILAVAVPRFFGAPSASPLPLRVQASASPARELSHLVTVADIPLPGGASRFDYQSVDPRRG